MSEDDILKIKTDMRTFWTGLQAVQLVNRIADEDDGPSGDLARDLRARWDLADARHEASERST